MTYTEKPRSKWGSILAGVPRSEPQTGNVVHLPKPNLDERAKRLHALDNQLMDIAIEMDRMAMRYGTLREEVMRERADFLEALKDSGIKGEFVRTPPAVEMVEPGS